MPLSSLFTIPLACASFSFFHATKWLLHRLRRGRERKQDALHWQTISEVLARPLALPYIMVTGPRWNPHALISRVGPFRVEQTLRIKVESAQQSAQAWTLIINHAADLHPCAVIDAAEVPQGEVWYEQKLPSGRYVAVLRYYEWSATPRLPEMLIDDRRRILERAVSSDENTYLNGLRKHERILYVCLHYYVLEILRLRWYLPAAFVRREYLPVGNPETSFDYGALRRGQRVEVSSDGGIPDGQRLYLTVYNRASFPIFWTEVCTLPYRSSPMEGAGTYLWRLHAMHSRVTPPAWPTHLQVRVQ